MLRFVPVIYLVLFGFPPAVWSAPFEEGAEFSRVEVQFATDSSGILIAYECSTCPPKNLIFNNKLRVLNSDGSTMAEKLSNLEGKAVVITWKPGTVQAFRIWPNF